MVKAASFMVVVIGGIILLPVAILLFMGVIGLIGMLKWWALLIPAVLLIMFCVATAEGQKRSAETWRMVRRPTAHRE